MNDTFPADTLAVAWAAGLPVWAVSDFAAPTTLETLAQAGADVGCVACFTRRIPASLLKLPRLGFLNLHPSLLPLYRGPSPLFWQLRDGAPTGVTIHYMDEGWDTGDIAAQTGVPLPDGISGAEAERTLTEAGVELLSCVLRDLDRNVIRRVPQPPGGTYQSRPQKADFSISTQWPARRAYNFMRGTAEWGVAYAVDIAGRTEYLAAADDMAPELNLDRPSVRHGRHILIRFNPGILYAKTIG